MRFWMLLACCFGAGVIGGAMLTPAGQVIVGLILLVAWTQSKEPLASVIYGCMGLAVVAGFIAADTYIYMAVNKETILNTGERLRQVLFR